MSQFSCPVTPCFFDDDTREPSADPFEHLYGKVDPSDGIPFRRAEPKEVLRGGDGSGILPAFSWRYITRKGRKYRVRVKFRQKLVSLGYFKTHREAQRARDQFFEKVYGPQWIEQMRAVPH